MNDDVGIWKKFAKIGLIGLTPLLLIFIFYQVSPGSTLFNDFLELTKNISANISSTNLALTKPLGMYCKLAPLFSIYFAIRYLRNVKSNPKTDNKASLVFYSCGFVAVYAMMFYIFVVSSFDISEGNRLLQVTAANETLTLLYYAIVFIGLYAMSFVLIMLVNLLYKELGKSGAIK